MKALISRYMLLKIEQRKIESKLNEVIKYYDTESLRTIFEPIGDSIMGTIGLELPHRKKEKDISPKQSAKFCILNDSLLEIIYF